MARYAFLTWNGAGNQPPAVGIAQALIDRGHDVVFAGYPSQREYFRARGSVPAAPSLVGRVAGSPGVRHVRSETALRLGRRGNIC